MKQRDRVVGSTTCTCTHTWDHRETASRVVGSSTCTHTCTSEDRDIAIGVIGSCKYMNTYMGRWGLTVHVGLGIKDKVHGIIGT